MGGDWNSERRERAAVNGCARGRGGEWLCKRVRDLKKKKILSLGLEREIREKEIRNSHASRATHVSFIFIIFYFLFFNLSWHATSNNFKIKNKSLVTSAFSI